MTVTPPLTFRGILFPLALVGLIFALWAGILTVALAVLLWVAA
jgi:hypothetical protein